MLVSWNWLKDYVQLQMSADELATRLAMAGLNHESTEAVGNDLAIDLEITSNRPDCLGHLGVAREISVLFDQGLCLPDPRPATGATAAADLVKVRIDAPELCPRYTARVIRGVKVGPSPAWLADRLTTLGIAVISNVVDITNYVLMECGQPLHAFDLAKLQGGQIVVRSAQAGEPFDAIDHRTYTLQPGMCVIGDMSRPVALGGVMGGAQTEVSSTTRDLLIEAADFDSMSIRSTSRALNLKSPSSYRFERGVDYDAIDWASRRACQLILELAGGELAAGVVDVVARPPVARQPVVLRLSQIRRVLGIDIDRREVERILQRLGLAAVGSDAHSITWNTPTWRRDLSREIDLIEEVARIHGYDKIPEDVGVPMAPSLRQDRHRVLTAVRQVLTASGFHEAMTASVVDERSSGLFSPWSSAEPIRSNMPMLRGANCLRRTLVPSLLESRRVNESRANEWVELFETAKVYLPAESGLPEERWVVALSSGRDFRTVKGIVEGIVRSLHIRAPLTTDACALEFLDGGQRCELKLGDERLGYLGAVGGEGRKAADLRKPTVVAELLLEVLQRHAHLIPQFQPFSDFPPISYDFNFVVDQHVRWADMQAALSSAAGPLLDALEYRETYRDPERDGPGRQRILVAARLRSTDHTLTGEEADAIRQAMIQACEQKVGAKLL